MLYKVKCGIFPDVEILNSKLVYYSTNDEISSLTQIEFIEEGLLIFPSGMSSTSNNTYDRNTLYDAVKDIIGDDVDKLYVPVRASNAIDASRDYICVNSLSYALPSIFNVYKSFFAASLNKNSTDCLVYYIPSLKKILFARTAATNTIIANVGLDGALTSFTYLSSSIFGNSNMFLSFMTSSSTARIYINLPVFSGEQFDESSAKNPNNWFCLQIESSYDGRMYLRTSPTGYSSANGAALLFSDFSQPDYKEVVDPFEPGGISGPNDTPPGTFDETSDPIPDSPIPTLTMADTGFTRIYNPTLSQVQQLAEYMWKTEDIFETLWNKVKQSFENPMDVMIAFNIVPVEVPSAGTVDFSIMYIPTGVQLTRAATQFIDVDCGTLELNGYYGSALDYFPNTKIQCYLPFIGMVDINPDEVMNTTLQIVYRIDIVSGGCVAKILVDNNVLYQFSGHCAVSVPFSASDFSSYMAAMIQVAGMAATGIVAGAAAAGADMGMFAANRISQNTGRTVTTGSTTEGTFDRDTKWYTPVTNTNTITQVDRQSESTQASFDGLTPSNIANTVSSVMGSKAIITHAGTFNGVTGYLGVRYPYLVITIPRQCLPASYQTMNGYPSMITLSLGDCTGYTRVQQVQLTGMTATNPEQAEILQLLKDGVIL